MTFDVVVLGSGISGSTLALITARHGLSTLMIDRGRHPRFAVGESMIPGTSYLLRIMADRYDVPELDHISTFVKQRRYVTGSSGIKRNFSFVHHGTDGAFDARKSTMLPVAHHPHGAESHLMRQDIDAYLFAAAIRYGAEALQETVVSSLERDESGWTIKTKCGRELRAKYVVDGSGYDSVLGKHLGWRESPTRLRTHSRSIFTHMVNVRPFDEFYGKDAHGLPQPLSQGTLHHIFEGGWLWVIPFDNYESATNPLCSVGLQLDPRLYPEDGRPPEQEFRDFLRRFPEIAPQFAEARATRSWVSAPRLQYSSRTVVAERCCMTAHSAGFVDPLFSRGLYVTMETINALAHRLITATRENDYSMERFAGLEQLTQGLIDAHDRVVHGSFIAFKNFELWNAWYRVWALGGTLSSLRFRRAHVWYKRTRDRRYLDQLEEHPYLGTLSADHPEYQAVFEAAYAIVCAVEAGELDERAAVERLYALYRDKPWIPPIYQLDNPAKRYISRGDLPSLVQSTYWGYRQAPEEIRRLYFDFPAFEIARGVVNSWLQESRWYGRLMSAARYARFERYHAAHAPRRRSEPSPQGQLAAAPNKTVSPPKAVVSEAPAARSVHASA